jgi:hypothetical protein
MEHPAQLPRQVEPIGYRGVHPGTAAGSHPVSGIAQEKGVPGSEALCDGRGERESPVIKNARAHLERQQPLESSGSAHLQ